MDMRQTHTHLGLQVSRTSHVTLRKACLHRGKRGQRWQSCSTRPACQRGRVRATKCLLRRGWVASAHLRASRGSSPPYSQAINRAAASWPGLVTPMRRQTHGPLSPVLLRMGRNSLRRSSRVPGRHPLAPNAYDISLCSAILPLRSTSVSIWPQYLEVGPTMVIPVGRQS